MRARLLVPALALALGLGACGYFNSLYNANRSFDEARRAERRGETTAAATAYRTAIDNAASSYRRHGDSRWADDALMLIGRARYALDDFEGARAAFITLLQERPDGGLAPAANAWLGASEAALGHRTEARHRLDTALASGPDDESLALARLWRGRLLLDADDSTGWTDLDAAAASKTTFSPDANIELAGRAVGAGDTARARIAFDRLLRDRAAIPHSDSITALIDATHGEFGASFTRSVIEPLEHGDWPADRREPELLRRIDLAASSGDTAAAIAEAIDLADRATQSTRARARVIAARYRLAGVEDPSELGAVRAILLPVVGDGAAHQLVRTLRAVEILLNRAIDGGDPLSVFAAAEWARDQLGAPVLARRLFLMYADLAPTAVWAPKAMLAAAALDTNRDETGDVAERIAQRPDNPYANVVMAGTGDAEAFTTAEQRLSSSLSALRAAALRQADASDVGVTTVVARLDSIRATALADSTRVRCSVLIDSLSLVGIRSDSARVACMRSDSARVNEVLRIDTMLLMDTSAVRRDTANGRLLPDTSATGRGRGRLGWTPFGPATR